MTKMKLAVAILTAVLIVPGLCSADAGEWTWMSGSGTGYHDGVYGEKGIADAANIPGSRNSSVSCTDSSGTFWLFGGYGRDSAGTNSYLNDLWRYDSDNNTWTWVSGSNLINQAAVYGDQGVADDTNVPSARYTRSFWADSDDNLWIFGGYGRDSVGTRSYLNDLWRYNPATDMWTWMGGSNIANQVGTYGTKGTADASNMPGARSNHISWKDSSGIFWVFGGQGYDSVRNGTLNDLWSYDPVSEMWTWMSGSSTRNQLGVYGEQGIANAANVPGARYESITSADNDGNLWLFGGRGYDAYGGSTIPRLNDLWVYSTDNGTWTWMSGSKSGNQFGVYGEKGIADADNVPGARGRGLSWMDRSGNFWLFGGQGNGSSAYYNAMGDFWKYNSATGMWVWINGPDSGNLGGTCGDKGIADIDNIPGSRLSSISWTDDAGNFWLFSGQGYDCSDVYYSPNDLWRYELPECASDSDCDDGDFCNGAETCDNGTCIVSENPCDNSTLLCDEINDLCVECLDSTDCDDDGMYCTGDPVCDNGVCDLAGNPCDNSTQLCDEVNDICVECFNDTDCEDDGLYCTGDPICDEGLCDFTGNPCDNATTVCDEFGESCVECVDDGDCAETDICRDTVCVSGCELLIKYKIIKSEKLSKPRKRAFIISGGEGFDPYGEINFEPFEIIKSKIKDRKQILKIKAIVPAELEPGWVPVSVGNCSGEIEITGTLPQ